MDPVAFASRRTLLAGYGALRDGRSSSTWTRGEELAVVEAAMLARLRVVLDFGFAIAADAGISKEVFTPCPATPTAPGFREDRAPGAGLCGAMTRTPVEVSNSFVGLRAPGQSPRSSSWHEGVALEPGARLNSALGLGGRLLRRRVYGARRPASAPSVASRGSSASIGWSAPSASCRRSGRAGRPRSGSRAPTPPAAGRRRCAPMSPRFGRPAQLAEHVPPTEFLGVGVMRVPRPRSSTRSSIGT